MIENIYIVWCKTNKNIRKFDMGIFTKQKTADKVASKIMFAYKVWVSEYRLSKPIHNEG